MNKNNESFNINDSPQCVPQVVNIPNPLYKSLQGIYFVGQTEMLALGKGFYSWGGLINPYESKVNLFVNTLTISNFSCEPFTAQIWFNPKAPGGGIASRKISAANTSIIPNPVPKAKLKYIPSIKDIPTGGTNVFTRIVPPNTTLVSEEDGKFIFPPGGSFIVFLKASCEDNIQKARIAFGWWEE